MPSYRHDCIGHKCPPTGTIVSGINLFLTGSGMPSYRHDYIGHECPPTGTIISGINALLPVRRMELTFENEIK